MKLSGSEILAHLVHPGDQSAGQNVSQVAVLVQKLLDEFGDLARIAIVQYRCNLLIDVCYCLRLLLSDWDENDRRMGTMWRYCRAASALRIRFAPSIIAR